MSVWITTEQTIVQIGVAVGPQGIQGPAGPTGPAGAGGGAGLTNGLVVTVTGTGQGSLLDAPASVPAAPTLGAGRGQVLRIRAGGLWTTSPAPLGITFRITVNGTDIGAGVFVNPPQRGTTSPWLLEVDIQIQGNGADVGFASITRAQMVDGTGAITSALAAISAGAGYNSNQANTIGVTAQWNGVGGSLSVHSLSIEQVGS